MQSTDIISTEGQQLGTSRDRAPEVLTIADAAAILHCSKAHVQNILAGKVKCVPPLPFVSLGRRKLIRRESLLRWLEKAEGEW
jgi:excisionase family DNA binding protein